MPFRTIVILLILFLSLLLSMGYLGLRTSYYILSFLFILLAILFTVKKDWYGKYAKFMTPKTYQLYLDKGPDFMRKNRITNIVMFYVMALLFFYGTTLMEENRHLPIGTYIPITGLVLVTTVIAYFVNNIILKRVKSNRQYIFWSALLGLIMGVILLIGVVFYIVSTIFL